MRPVAALPGDVARSLRGVLFDIDDTVLDHGRLAPPTLQAMYALQAQGLLLVGVTGRPVAWGQALLRQWPVAGMVTENGALALRIVERRVVVMDRLGVEERGRRRQRLLQLSHDVSSQFAQLRPSDDVLGRQADYTFDIGEAVKVPADTIAQAAAFARSRGARVTRSSIHLHLSYDLDDKATGTLRFLREALGLDPTACLSQFAFIGDSENDSACFNAFHTTVGVANLRGRPSIVPRFITKSAMGAGFVEFAQQLLAKLQRR